MATLINLKATQAMREEIGIQGSHGKAQLIVGVRINCADIARGTGMTLAHINGGRAHTGDDWCIVGASYIDHQLLLNDTAIAFVQSKCLLHNLALVKCIKLLIVCE